MSFNTSGNSGSSTKQGFEKAIAFVNIFAPGADGPEKIGAIALKESVESEKWLAEYLAKDPANLDKLKGKLTLTFNMVKAKTSVGFSLD